MNETLRKIGIYVLSCIFIFTLCTSLAVNGYQFYRISKFRSTVSELESELERYRTRVDNLTESEREFANIIDEASELVKGADRSISSIGNSVQSIRNGLRELQEYVKKLENLLCISDSVSSNDGNNSDNSSD